MSFDLTILFFYFNPFHIYTYMHINATNLVYRERENMILIKWVSTGYNIIVNRFKIALREPIIYYTCCCKDYVSFSSIQVFTRKKFILRNEYLGLCIIFIRKYWTYMCYD